MLDQEGLVVWLSQTNDLTFICATFFEHRHHGGHPALTEAKVVMATTGAEEDGREGE